MNKSELIEAIASGLGATKADTGRFVDTFMLTVIDALKNGDKVELTGFGAWFTGNRPERTGRNPQTGAPIKIKASRVAKFKAGKSLKDAVQGS
jgi:DNA-binding protein HU-beta